jgi:transcriptional regulator with XRE-family HTH domain
MARPPKPEHANNPLRQLRGLLKDPAVGEHISQNELAQLCHVPVDTIKSIEAGRLALNATALRNIAEETGARWDHEEEHWTRFDKTEFNFSSFSDYRRERLTPPSSIDKAVADLMIKSRIDWLFENVPAESWKRLRSRLIIFLSECKRDFQLTANDALFYRPASLSSANESAAAQPVKPEQQKRKHAPNRRGQRGAIAGNKKRRRKYGQ